MNWHEEVDLYLPRYAMSTCSNISPRGLLHHLQQGVARWGFLHHAWILLHNAWSFLQHMSHDLSSSGPLRKIENCLFLGTKMGTFADQKCFCLDEKQVCKPGQNFIAAGFTFSLPCSALRNWANNSRYRLRLNHPAQPGWSSSRPHPLSKMWPYQVQQ